MRIAVESIDQLSLGQLIALAKNTKITSLAFTVSVFIAYTTTIFWIGKAFQADATAISYNRPFGMQVSEPKEYTYPFGSLIITRQYLVEDESQERVSSLLRRRNDEDGMYEEIGTVMAQKTRIRELLPDSSWAIISNAYAQNEEKFDWYGHKDDYKFYEKFESKTKIRRYYDDGWILQYEVDADGRGIPASRQWIETN